MDCNTPHTTINLWSGPRCCSTSLMYSFAQRSDCQVLDEPLYASYLKQTGYERPYSQLVFDAQNVNGEEVFVKQIQGQCSKPILFAKHMAKHKLGVSNHIFREGKHVLLLREPYAVLQSFSKVLEPTQQELGYAALLEILSELRCRGQPIIVVMSDMLVKQPEAMLTALCQALDIKFDPSMLSWPSGPKPYDGVWADWWYANTHSSTGFSAHLQTDRQPLPSYLKPLLGECQAIYRLIKRHALPPATLPVPRSISDSGPPEIGNPESHDNIKGHENQNKVESHGPFSSEAHYKESGTHVYKQDPRNHDILILIRDGVDGSESLIWRPEARIPVLDSGFMLGDGVWEGIRLHKGCLMFIEEHLDRLYEGSKALDMDIGLSKEQMQQLVYDAVDANSMSTDSGIHIRLMVTRGLKPTPYQSPYITIGKPTIVVIPEYKESAPGPKQNGISLFTCHVRRGTADVQDPMWNSHSKLNCIAACIQAKHAGVDEALMLDPHGFVATCNSVNFFCVRRGEVWAPTTKYQLHGITRANILKLCRDNNIPSRELDFSLTQVYSADEAFVTGTFAGVIPVKEVDGRKIGVAELGPVALKLQQLYVNLMEQYAAQGRRNLS